MKNKAFLLVVILLLPFAVISQNKEGTVSETIVIQDSIVEKPMDPLTPSRAAFYSAILPGLGQAYNKKYWKIPIVYAALGTGLYFYADNNKDYKRYRNAYKSRLAGFSDDEFWGEDVEGNPLTSPNISNDGLIRAQRTLRRNKEISLLVTIGLYALNIIDANVDAHLLQYNVDDNLAIKPHFNFNEMDATTNLGLTLDFKF